MDSNLFVPGLSLPIPDFVLTVTPEGKRKAQNRAAQRKHRKAVKERMERAEQQLEGSKTTTPPSRIATSPEIVSKDNELSPDFSDFAPPEPYPSNVRLQQSANQDGMLYPASPTFSHFMANNPNPPYIPSDIASSYCYQPHVSGHPLPVQQMTIPDTSHRCTFISPISLYQTPSDSIPPNPLHHAANDSKRSCENLGYVGSRHVRASSLSSATSTRRRDSTFQPRTPNGQVTTPDSSVPQLGSLSSSSSSSSFVSNGSTGSGPNLEGPNRQGLNPLHIATEEGHERIVRLLLKGGANIEACTPSGERPLHIATRHGHGAIVRLLLLGGADIASENGNRETALHLAAEAGHEQIVELLLGGINNA